MRDESRNSNRVIPRRAVGGYFAIITPLAWYTSIAATTVITTASATNIQPIVSICAVYFGSVVSCRSVIETSTIHFQTTRHELFQK